MLGQAVITGPVLVPSEEMEKLLLKKVAPLYPPLAQKEHVQGPVYLRVIVSKAGAVESTKVLSGDPLLQNAARDAVKRWTFKPYLAGDQPIEVQTTVMVNFTFDSLGNPSAAKW